MDDHNLSKKFIPVTSVTSGDGMTISSDISPRYLTPDWQAAKKSVEKLAALKPALAVTGHGLPMSGQELTDSLARLVAEFDAIAKPDYGKFVD